MFLVTCYLILVADTTGSNQTLVIEAAITCSDMMCIYDKKSDLALTIKQQLSALAMFDTIPESSFTVTSILDKVDEGFDQTAYLERERERERER